MRPTIDGAYGCRYGLTSGAPGRWRRLAQPVHSPYEPYERDAR